MTGSSDAPPATRPGMPAQLGPRRHRRLTAPFGAVLFICLFLPAEKACNGALYPITVPFAWHPYLFGLVFALGAWATTPHGVRRMILALRGLAYTAAGLAALISALIVTDGHGDETLLTVGMCGGSAAALIAAVGVRGYSERRAAVTAIVAGAGSAIWFGLWIANGKALYGVYVSLGAALGLAAGGLCWLGDLARQPNRPVM